MEKRSRRGSAPALVPPASPDHLGNEPRAARRVTLRPVSETDPTLPFPTRLWFAWACFFRVLFDGAFAARAFAAREAPALPAAPASTPVPPSIKAAPVEEAAPKSFRSVSKASEKAPPGQPIDPALQLLALLQRDGRFIDFLEQEIGTFPDVEIGAVARVVHEGAARPSTLTRRSRRFARKKRAPA